jgi:hypothetical protein
VFLAYVTASLPALRLYPHGEERREAARLEPRGPDASAGLMLGPASFETRFFEALLRMRE